MNLLSRIQVRCEEFPHEIAIKKDAHAITYEAIWQAANSLAYELIARQIKNSCIAIYLDNKADTIIAMLGVLLSDNYYLCLPQLADFDAIVNQVDTAFCITNEDEPILLGVPSMPFPTHISDEKISYWWQEQVLNLKWCCVYCTSGSTGETKYVLHDYASIEEDTYRQVEENVITPTDRIDFLYAASFSSALASIFPALVSGATIVTFDFSRDSVVDLAAFWSNHQITFTTLVPSSFRSLCIASGQKLKHYNTSLRYVSLGGEKVLDEDVAMFKQLFHDSTRLQIAYASTETRTATQIQIDKNSEYKESNVGGMVRSKTVYINGHGYPQDQNTICGEVMVRSKFISVGYFQNRKLKTHPISSGERVYKTGDIGYFTEEGNLMITGRTNALIKVNGVYLDLNILEHELRAITKKNCIVISNKDYHLLDYLVAFIETDEHLDVTQIRQQINGKLSLPIFPREYVQLTQLPLNKNEKVDREALKKHETLNTHSNTKSAVFQDDSILEAIMFCWQNLLNLNHFSIHDDFFHDLGGSSLLSMIAISEIEQTLKIKLDSNSIFNCRTAYNLAESIRSKTKYPKIELINDPSENKPYLFFLQYGSTNEFHYLVNDSLTECFNVGNLRYDLFSILNGKKSKVLKKELAELLQPYKELVLVGSSFNGFAGAKLSSHLKSKCYVVLLDTPFYKNVGKSITQETLTSKSGYLITKLFSSLKNESVSKTSKLVFDFFNKRVNKKNNTTVLGNSVSSFVRELGPVNQVQNLLYVYSKQSSETSHRDISLWKASVKNHFILEKLSGGHNIAKSEQLGAHTSSKIIEFYHRASVIPSTSESITV